MDANRREYCFRVPLHAQGRHEVGSVQKFKTSNDLDSQPERLQVPPKRVMTTFCDRVTLNDSRQMRWMKKRQSEGNCIRCGKPRPDNDPHYCAGCRLKVRELSFKNNRKNSKMAADAPKLKRRNVIYTTPSPKKDGIQ